jgi:translation initiation factor 2 alpha subunit (eIF-2alpha)
MQFNDCAHCKEPISIHDRICDICRDIETNDLMKENQSLKEQLESCKETLMKYVDQSKEYGMENYNLKQFKDLWGQLEPIFCNVVGENNAGNGSGESAVEVLKRIIKERDNLKQALEKIEKLLINGSFDKKGFDKIKKILDEVKK